MEVYLASESFFSNNVWFFFFITPRHPERCASSYALASKNDSGSHFFSKSFWLFFFFITSLFLLFHKNYYHFTKGKKPAQSPKPAVSFPLNPFLLGHGLGFYPKNPPTSKWVALATNKSVWQKQIRMTLYLFCYSLWKNRNFSTIKIFFFADFCADN